MIASGTRAPSVPADAAAVAPEDLAAAFPPPRCVARLVPLDPGFYAVSLVAPTAGQGPTAGLALPAVQVCQPPHGDGTIEITDGFGRAGSWLGGRHRMLFVSVPGGGAAALLTAYLDDASLELEIRRIGAVGGAAPEPPLGGKLRLTLAAPGAASQSPQPVGLEIIAHVRGRGDLRFVDTPSIGRLGRGLWIEALTIVPRDRSAAAAIEYKGLTAGGAETPWTGCGAPCGTQGRGLPLIGLAVRQKAAAAEALFDCEYTGYFQSGATAGPSRNGAPCRSAVDGDPLEGLELRITRRPAPTASR